MIPFFFFFFFFFSFFFDAVYYINHMFEGSKYRGVHFVRTNPLPDPGPYCSFQVDESKIMFNLPPFMLHTCSINAYSLYRYG